MRSQLKNNEVEDKLSAEHKKVALNDISGQIARTQAATRDKEKMIDEAHTALEECRPLIWKTVSFLSREMPEIIRVAYEGDAPQMKAAPQDDQQENLSAYLLYVEDCLNQFRVCLDKDTRMQRVLPQPKASTPGVKKPNDLPSAQNIAGDDSDDDPETGMGDRPLDRMELKDRAQQNIARRRRKPNQVRAEERSRQEVEDGSGMASTPKADQAPANFQSDQAGARRNGDIERRPSGLSVKQATGGAGKSDAVPEEEGDRKEMWWRQQGRSSKQL
jgi:hypothetical protein